LAENSPDLIARFDRQYRHLYVNLTAAKSGRLTPEEYVGKTIAEVGIPEEEARKWEERIRTAFETGQIVDVEDTFETPNGLQYFNTKFVPEFAPEGSILWVQSIARNITERMLAKEEIRESKKLFEDLHKHLNEIIENERASISREIHDQIGQSLTALKLDLNWMHKDINTNPDAVAKLEVMIELVSNSIKNVQRISSDLRPGILDDLGLAAAIEWYCDEFEMRTGIKCSLRLSESNFNDSQKNLVFFRVLQEALTNVIRHANASSVTIKLHQSKQGTTMTIQDDGIGMHPGKAESGKSLGLIGMRERVKQFGGKFDILSKKGEGTKLTIFIHS
jgi:two-component system sensor histidine kinase UhpB